MGNDAWNERDFGGSEAADIALIRAELAPGETLVWQGRPALGRLVLWTVPIALVGVPFGGFALFWIGTASWMADRSPFPATRFVALVGVPFLLVGIGMILAPAWVAWRGSRTRYAVTDRRAIVCEPQFAAGMQTRSYPPDTLRRMIRNQRGDGSGDLIFEEIPTFGPRGRTRITRRGFFAISDVRGVETLIRSTLLTDRS